MQYTLKSFQRQADIYSQMLMCLIHHKVFFFSSFPIKMSSRAHLKPTHFQMCCFDKSIPENVWHSVTLVGLLLRWQAKKLGGLIVSQPAQNEDGNTDEALCAQVVFSRFPSGQGSPPLACRPYQHQDRAAFSASVTSVAWFHSCTVSSDDLSPEGRTRMSLEVTDKV